MNIAVFFGRVDKRLSGWYWTPTSEKLILKSGLIAGPFETKAAASEDASTTIEVTCALSRISFTVPPDRSILDLVLEHVDPDYPYSCSEGYCGSCATGVLVGIPDHRDEVLTDEERAENKIMMICVDRSLTERLVLDL